MKKSTFLIIIVLLATLSFDCEQRTPVDTRAADERAIREADSTWSRTAAAKDLEGTVSYYASDASMFQANAPIANGLEAIRKAWSQDLFATPGYALSWRTTKVEVSRGGDLGYASGTYEFTFNDAKGMPVTYRGKYVEVWKKQADGAWKVVVDIYNSDLPAVTTSSQ